MTQSLRTNQPCAQFTVHVTPALLFFLISNNQADSAMKSDSEVGPV